MCSRFLLEKENFQKMAVKKRVKFKLRIFMWELRKDGFFLNMTNKNKRLSSHL